MIEDYFNFLHDGIVNQVTGSVPGELLLEVNCSYLRTRISEAGSNFILKLKNCQHIGFRPYVEEGVGEEINDLNEILKFSLEFVSAKKEDIQIWVITTEGELILQCDSIEIWLNKIKQFSLPELESVSTQYWKEWKDIHKL